MPRAQWCHVHSDATCTVMPRAQWCHVHTDGRKKQGVGPCSPRAPPLRRRSHRRVGLTHAPAATVIVPCCPCCHCDSPGGCCWSRVLCPPARPLPPPGTTLGHRAAWMIFMGCVARVGTGGQGEQPGRPGARSVVWHCSPGCSARRLLVPGHLKVEQQLGAPCWMCVRTRYSSCYYVIHTYAYTYAYMPHKWSTQAKCAGHACDLCGFNPLRIQVTSFAHVLFQCTCWDVLEVCMWTTRAAWRVRELRCHKKITQGVTKRAWQGPGSTAGMAALLVIHDSLRPRPCHSVPVTLTLSLCPCHSNPVTLTLSL